MEQGAGKLTTLAEFNGDVSPDEIKLVIRDYDTISKEVPSRKDFYWGTNIGNKHGMNLGYTHVFELRFEDSEGVEEFLANRNYKAFCENDFCPKLKKVVVIGYTANKVPQ